MILYVLDEIRGDVEGVVYCQPSSCTFGALDSFILDISEKKCFGLQMTLNKDHGVKFQPLQNFLTWLRTKMGIDLKGFYFGFMVLEYLAGDFQKQVFLTSGSKVHRQPGQLVNMKQFVVPFAPFEF